MCYLKLSKIGCIHHPCNPIVGHNYLQLLYSPAAADCWALVKEVLAKVEPATNSQGATNRQGKAAGIALGVVDESHIQDASVGPKKHCATGNWPRTPRT